MEDVEIVRTLTKETKSEIKSEVTDKESVENFQKFIYELFEKNGILNDLRAYLRQHIIEVLKSSQAGDTPMCQKNFSERLELKSQAMNILIAEYLLSLGFNYTLSVFVSEIPLANMVFDFARNLMKGDRDSALHFKDKDICSIINYLGIKCDSNVITNIVEMYKNEKQQPLLVCIIKSLSVLPVETPGVEIVTSSEEIAFSDHSSDSISEKTGKKYTKKGKCYHYAICKSCHNKLLRFKKLCKKKEAGRMFEQLRTVYEREVEMARSEQDRRAREQHSHLLAQREQMEEAFKAREEELERGVRAKKKFLWGLAQSLRAQHERLARAMAAVQCHSQRLRTKEENLKSQLAEVEHLMMNRNEDMQAKISGELIALESQLHNVKREREAVNKEKLDLEQLRNQMSTSHATINQIEEIEAVSDTAWSNYDLLKNELSIIRKYVESARVDPKAVMDRGTVTVVNAQTVKSAELLNNEQEVKAVREEDSKLKNNQLVNDFKKQKNVNFSMGNLEVMQVEREKTVQEEATRADDEDPTLVQLKLENERLKEYARQQELQMQQMRAEMARAPRPRTAPAAQPPAQTQFISPNEIPCTNKLGWRCKGAGEETTLFTCVPPPRVFVPGETVPFIGLLHDRHAESKRLMNQWRTARRASPLRARRPPSPAPAPAPRHVPPSPRTPHTPEPARRLTPDRDSTYANETSSLAPTEKMDRPNQPEILVLDPELPKQEHALRPAMAPPSPSPSPRPRRCAGAGARAKSPKSVLREAKEKLRTHSNNKYLTTRQTPSERDKSPATVLREAKMRLRKLEIEAEAVEKSYLDYRNRQNALKRERIQSAAVKEEAIVTKDIGDLTTKLKTSFQRLNEMLKPAQPPHSDETKNPAQNNFHTFCREYREKFNLSETQFCNRNTAAVKVKPIPDAFSSRWESEEQSNVEMNYLETPLAEFRKYYRPNEVPSKKEANENETIQDRVKISPSKIAPRSCSPVKPSLHVEERPNFDEHANLETEVEEPEAKKEALDKVKNSKKLELEILKQNITKMYNTVDADEDKTEGQKVSQDVHEENTPMLLKDQEEINVLKNEVEDGKEATKMKIEQESDLAKGNVESDANSDAGDEKLRGDMTIIISPKHSSVEEIKSPHSKRSMSPEQAARLTRNDVLEAIFTVKVNSDDDASKGNDSDGEGAKDGEDYPDDFSADVDNYNSSRNDDLSPISRGHTPEDTFWDDSQSFP